jgi:hypothetical protein
MKSQESVTLLRPLLWVRFIVAIAVCTCQASRITTLVGRSQN